MDLVYKLMTRNTTAHLQIFLLYPIKNDKFSHVETEM